MVARVEKGQGAHHSPVIWANVETRCLRTQSKARLSGPPACMYTRQIHALDTLEVEDELHSASIQCMQRWPRISHAVDGGAWTLEAATSAGSVTGVEDRVWGA